MRKGEGMNIDWGKIFTRLLEELVQVLIPWGLEKLKHAIDDAYLWAEQWADDLLDRDAKPRPEEKMGIAVATLRAQVPELDGSTARLILEARHKAGMVQIAKKSGKTAQA